MTWEDRIQQARYISPSRAIRVEFTYEDVSQSFDKLTTGYSFPDGGGTYVQDLGRTGRKIPLRIIFWGPNYDLTASAFEEALRERGRGTLEHPMYGTIRVVPFGTIERSDRLKSAANQATFEVTFWESTNIGLPEVSGPSAATGAIGDAKLAAADEFAERADVDTAVERTSFREQMRSRVNSLRTAVAKVAGTVDAVKRQVDAVYNSINTGLDTLVGTPLTLASQVMTLATLPTRAASLISDKLDAYRNLADSIFSRAQALPGLDSRPVNEFLSYDYNAQITVVASAESVVATQFTTQAEAIGAADRLATLMDDFTAWRETDFDGLGVIDTGVAYDAIQSAVAATLQYVVDVALDLPQERAVILLRPRNFVELVAEIYGETDVSYDAFILANNLSGDEIIEIPTGRRIVYYA